MVFINGKEYYVAKIDGKNHLVLNSNTDEKAYLKCKRFHIVGPTLSESSLMNAKYEIDYCDKDVPEKCDHRIFNYKCCGLPAISLKDPKLGEEKEESVFTHDMFNKYYKPLIISLDSGVALSDYPCKGVSEWATMLCDELGTPTYEFHSKNYGTKNRYEKRNMAMVLFAPGSVIGFISKKDPKAKISETFWNVMGHIIVVDSIMEQYYDLEDIIGLKELVHNSGNIFNDLPKSIRYVAQDVYDIISV